ncbi:methyltransferase [Methanoplanus sp. FWC-SCC4]|uniref:Methyltransferase n=1 Tax=Methanochimaera problematica TaxID=2609417 RepID=A0AA97I499_9EURY|nr:methyltransferase [Methanoplanus sp. FWC-SCC4]WOF16721.1 methyltransferase [Methanoplanus sp. FWC-SCC4]
MSRKLFGVRVEKSKGEITRRELLGAGALSNDFRPLNDGDYLIFPVADEMMATGEYIFEERPKKEALPRHELIGGIAIMQDDDVRSAGLLLKSRPVIHTVLHSESAVQGEYRIKEFKVLAGKDTTETLYVEYGHRFLIDLSVAYFSARLANERQRIYEIMDENERVLDMFAGVGPFPIALSDKASVIFAGDINPGAVSLMQKNIGLNKKRNIIPMLADALHLGNILPAHSFDRIIMNLPMTSDEFLEVAFKLCKKGGTVHFYTLQSEEGEMTDTLRRFTKGSIREKMVRSYSPVQHHAVYDVCCE